MKRIYNLLALLVLFSVVGFSGIQQVIAAIPSTQARSITISNITTSGAKITWLNGNGTGRVVVVFPNTTDVTTIDDDIDEGELYTASTDFSSGSSTVIGSTGKVVYTGTGSTRTVTITGLSGGTKYNVKVYEYRNDGGVDPEYRTTAGTNNPRTFTTDNSVVPPTELATKSGTITPSGFTIQYTNAADVSYYELQVDNNSDFSSPLMDYDAVDIGKPSPTEFEIGNLNSNTNYSYRLRTIYNGFTSDWSSTANETTIEDNVKPTLTSLTINDNFISDSDIMSSFVIDLVFDEDMNQNIAPIITYSPDVNSTLNDGVGYWVSSTEYKYTLDIDDAGITASDVDIIVNTATDISGNVMLENTANGLNKFSIDTENPTLTSIQTESTNDNELTNATNVVFTVTFSEEVDGVTATCTDGGTVSAVPEDNDGFDNVWLVTVPTQSDDNNSSYDLTITGYDDIANNAGTDFTASPNNGYVVDRVLPTLTSIDTDSSTDNELTNDTNVDFTVTFSEEVDGVTAICTDGGTVIATPLVNNDGYDDVWIITVPTQSNDDNSSYNLTITGYNDIANNAGTDFVASPNYGYIVDRVLPVVTSINRLTPTTTDTPTNSDNATFRVTFSETVTGVESTDFVVDAVGVTGATINGSVVGTVNVYDITVNTIGGDGTISIDFTGLVNDLAGNANDGTDFILGEAFTIDNTLPTVIITRNEITAGTGFVTSDNTVSFDIDFSEQVINFTFADITINTTGTVASDALIAGSLVVDNGPAGEYSLTITGVTGDGNLGITLESTTFSDIVTNQMVTDAVSSVFTIDNTAPAVTSVNVTVVGNNEQSLSGWGYNEFGKLGAGTVGNVDIPITSIGNDTDWEKVDAGGLLSLAIKSDGTLWAWGHNNQGQLGIGSSGTNMLSPVQVGSATNWRHISAGTYHALAINDNNELFTWGEDAYGKLGNGVSGSTNSPTQIAGSWLTAAAGYDHTLAIKNDGTLWAVGRGAYGRLGQNNETDQENFVQVGTATNWTAVSGGDHHSVALNSSGEVWTFGLNNYGQLGVGDNTNRLVPTKVSGSGYTKIVAGSISTFIMNSSNEIYAFGHNNSGELGNGSTTHATSPVKVSGSDYVSFDNESTSTAAIKSDGSLYVWGYNGRGQLGTNLNDDYLVSPTRLGTSNSWSQISVGRDYMIGVNSPYAKTINEFAAGDDKFTVEVNFSEALDNTVDPTITFSPSVASTLTFASDAWSNANARYTATYDVTDNNVEVDDVDIEVTLGKDPATNVMSTSNNADKFDIDTKKPTVSTIVRTGGAAELLTSNTASFTVTFDEDIIGSTLVAGDFAIANLDGDVTGTINVTNITGSVATVTVTTITGGGVLRLDFTGLVEDLSGNTNNGDDFITGESYNVDITPPTITSIVRTGAVAALTNATTVSYTVTFSELLNPMTVTTADFAVGTSGSIVSVSVGISDDIYTVVCSTAVSTYTSTLTLAGGHDIRDLAGNQLTNATPTGANETYSVDRDAPTATNVSTTTYNGTQVTGYYNSSNNGIRIQFTIPNDATLIGGKYTVQYTSNNGNDWSNFDNPDYTDNAIIAANGDDNDGNNGEINKVNTIDISEAQLVSNSFGALDDNEIWNFRVVLVDAAGNSSGYGNEATNDIIIDQTAPTITSIERTGGAVELTNATTVSYTVTFSELMNPASVTTADFEVGTAGSIASVTVGGTNDVYTVVCSTSVSTYTSTLTLTAGHDVRDAVSNQLTNAMPTGVNQTYAVDRTAPSVVSILRELPTTANIPTNSDDVTFRVTFNEPVSDVTFGDFAIDAVDVTGATVNSSVIAQSTTVYDVTVNTIAGNGTISIDFTGTATDLAGNNGDADYTAGQAFTIDNTAPSAVSAPTMTITGGTVVGGYYNSTNTGLTLAFTVPNEVNGSYQVQIWNGSSWVNFGSATTIIAGTVATANNEAGDVASIVIADGSLTSYVGSSNDGKLLKFRVQAIDQATNYTDGVESNAVSVKETLPTVISIVRKVGEPNPTNENDVDYTVTFNEVVTGVAIGDFDAVQASGTAVGTEDNVTNEDDIVYTVNVSSVSGDGNLRLDFTGLVTDVAGNDISTTDYTSGEVFTIDNTNPTLSVATPVGCILEDVAFEIVVTVEDAAYTSDKTKYTGSVGGQALTINSVSGTGTSRTLNATLANAPGTTGLYDLSITLTDLATNQTTDINNGVGGNQIKFSTGAGDPTLTKLVAVGSDAEYPLGVAFGTLTAQTSETICADGTTSVSFKYVTSIADGAAETVVLKRTRSASTTTLTVVSDYSLDKTTNTITLTNNNIVDGDSYQVFLTGDFTCEEISSGALTVTRNPLPTAATFSIGGATQPVCYNSGTVVTVTVDGGGESGFTYSYTYETLEGASTWTNRGSLTDNGSSVDITSNVISLTNIGSLLGGNTVDGIRITTTKTNSTTGCAQTSTTSTITVKEIVVTGAAPTGNASPTKGSAAVYEISTTGQNGTPTEYTWSYSGTGATITRSGTPNGAIATVTFASNASATGNLTYTAVGACNTGSASAVLGLTPQSSPSVFLTPSGATKTAMTINWTNGNADGKVILAQAGTTTNIKNGVTSVLASPSTLETTISGITASGNWTVGTSTVNVNSHITDWTTARLLLNETGNSTTSLSLSNLTCGTRYNFRIIDFDLVSSTRNYKTSAVGSFKLTSNCKIGIEDEYTTESGLNSVSVISPNPAKDNINFTLDIVEDAYVTITIHSIEGNTVMNVKQNELFGVGSHFFNIPLKDLAAGTYAISINLGSEMILETFVVMP